MFQSVPTAPGELQISEKMANAITGWLLAFYQRPAWLEAGYRVTRRPCGGKALSLRPEYLL